MSGTPNPWDERYAREDYYYGTEPNDFLREQVGLIPPSGRVLCLAEGEGRNAVFLAKSGFKVLAVDGSIVGLEKAKKLAQASGVRIETEVSDLARYRFEAGAFDAVISIWCHLPPTLRTRVHAESIRALKTGGVLILEAYRPKQLEYKTGGPPVAELMMSESSIREEMKDLDFLTLVERDREIHEGPGHDGMSAVIQFVGRKEG
jgi:SAM-dependent methyltransferase